MGGIFDAIAKAFYATAEIFGFARDRSKLKNAEDVKRAKIAQEEIEAKNRTEEAIRKHDLEQLRKDLAE